MLKNIVIFLVLNFILAGQLAAVQPMVMGKAGEIHNNELKNSYPDGSERIMNVWNGTSNQHWSDPLNWSLGRVPLLTDNVSIPAGTPFDPLITHSSTYMASCDNLWTNTGSHLTISNGQLELEGDASINGELEMDHSSAVFSVSGKITWENNSIATIADVSSGPYIRVYGDWEFEAGTVVQLQHGEVQFLGPDFQFIKSNASDSFFNDININKAAGYVALDISSSQDMDVMNFYNYNGEFRIHCIKNLIVHGDFYSNATCNIGNGAVVFSGGSQDIEFVSPGYFNDLVIQPTTTVTLSSNIDVNGDLSILSGNLNSMDYQINIEGDWTDNMRDGFIEGSGRVVFDNSSVSSHMLSSEVFNVLEINMPGNVLSVGSPGSLVVECNSYDRTAGSLSVNNNGEFWAYDLADNGLYGGFYCTGGGAIHLNQDSEQYVDVNGSIYIHNGVITVSGGKDNSYWSFDDPASVTIVSGVLDFMTTGIYTSASNPVTVNISGGRIRTAGQFTINILNFTPTGGVVELYGPENKYVSHVPGNCFHDLEINKGPIVYDYRTKTYKKWEKPEQNNLNPRHEQGEAMRYGSGTSNSRSNVITAQTDLNINGDFSILGGAFSTNNQDMWVGGNWTNNIDESAFDEATAKVTFDGPTPATITADETFYDVDVDKASAKSGFTDIASSVTVDVGNKLHIKNGFLGLGDLSTLNIEGDLEIDLSAGLNAAIDPSYLPIIQLKGDWTNHNTTYGPTFGFSPGLSVVVFNGDVDQTLYTDATTEDFHHLLIYEPLGKFKTWDGIRVNGNFELNTTFEDGTAGQTYYFGGNFNVMSSGLWPAFFDQTVVFEGNQTSQVSMLPGRGLFRNVTINKGIPLKEFNSKEENRSPVVLMHSQLNCSNGGTLTIDEGLLDMNGNLLYTTGDVDINDGGGLRLFENSTFKIADGKTVTVNSGGTIDILGVPGNETLITHTSSGYYNFNVMAGGTIYASRAIFEYSGYNGIFVDDGGIVDNDDCFHNCTFRYGSDATLAALLVINNTQDLKIYKPVFPSAKRAASYNVVKEYDYGSITLYHASGAFAGEAFEYDNHDRIHWEDPVLDVSPDYRDVIDTTDVTSFNVSNTGTGDMTWTAQVIEGASWLSISSGSSGTNSGTIHVDFETNNWAARTGKIRIIAPWSDIEVDTVEVRQPAAEYYIVIPSDTLICGDDTCIAAKKTITVPEAGGDYLVSPSVGLTLIAEQTIKLNAGFHAANGSYFHAFISDLPCVVKTPPLLVDDVYDEEDEEAWFNIFPNPATRKITIDQLGKPCEHDIYLEIYNSLGKSVYSNQLQSQNQWEIDISALPTGLYFVKAICGEEIFIRKFVKH